MIFFLGRLSPSTIPYLPRRLRHLVPAYWNPKCATASNMKSYVNVNVWNLFSSSPFTGKFLPRFPRWKFRRIRIADEWPRRSIDVSMTSAEIKREVNHWDETSNDNHVHRYVTTHARPILHMLLQSPSWDGRRARYTLATKSKGRSTFDRVEHVQIWRQCRPRQNGDNSTKSKVDSVKFVVTRQCVPSFKLQLGWAFVILQRKRANFGKLYSFDKHGLILIIFGDQHQHTFNKKLSYRWQTARCWFVKLLRYGRIFCQNT